MGKLRIFEDDVFINYLRDELQDVISIVKNDPELELCYRKTNRNNIINIYYKGYSVLKITQNKPSRGVWYKGEISGGVFDHNSKRGTDAELPIVVKEIRGKGKINKKNKFYKNFKNRDINEWVKLIKDIKNCCDEYNCSSKEKVYQQELFSDRVKEFKFLDMEYNPIKNSKYDKNGGGRFDLIGINKEGKIVLGEVKFDSKSCEGDSGVIDHIKKTCRFIESSKSNKTNWIKDKKEELEFWADSNSKLELKTIGNAEIKLEAIYLLIRYFPQNIEKSKEQIAGFESDKMRLTEGTKENADGFSPMVINGTSHTDKGKAGAALIEACKQITSTEPVNVGSYRGFDMNLSFDTFNKTHRLTLKGTMSYPTDLGTDTFGNITRINNVFGDLPQRLTSVQAHMENLYQQMDNAKIELQKPFPLEAALAEKSGRLAVLDAELNMDKGGEPEQLGGDDDVDIEVDVAERVPAKGKPSILETLRNGISKDKPLDKTEREKAQDTCL